MGGTMARRRPGAKKAQASLVASKAEANKKYEQASKTQDKKPAKKSKGQRMALTDKQKHDVVFKLGWSGLTIVTGSTQYNSVVNDRLTNLNAEIERVIETEVARLGDSRSPQNG